MTGVSKPVDRRERIEGFLSFCPGRARDGPTCLLAEGTVGKILVTEEVKPNSVSGAIRKDKNTDGGATRVPAV
jgi:hypothetical protein